MPIYYNPLPQSPIRYNPLPYRATPTPRFDINKINFTPTITLPKSGGNTIAGRASGQSKPTAKTTSKLTPKATSLKKVTAGVTVQPIKPEAPTLPDLIGFRQPATPRMPWTDGNRPPYNPLSGYRQPANPGVDWRDIVDESLRESTPYRGNWENERDIPKNWLNEKEYQRQSILNWPNWRDIPKNWLNELLYEPEIGPEPEPVYYGGYGGGWGGWGGYGGGGGYGGSDYVSPFDFFFNRLNWRI